MTTISPDRPYLLAIETSGLYGSVSVTAVGENRLPEDVGTLELTRTGRSARTLAPAINDLLTTRDVQGEQLGAIAVTVGPGSFTGLRVGITTAKTMAYVLKTKLFGINTLACLGNDFQAENTNVWCMIDAQRNEWFTWKRQPNSNEECSVTRLSQEELSSCLSEDDLIVGPEVSKLANRLGDDSEKFRWHESPVSSQSLAELGSSLWVNGESHDLFQLVPEYHRPSAAEENYDRQQAKR